MKQIFKLCLLFAVSMTLGYCSSKVLPPTSLQLDELKKANPEADTTKIFTGYQVYSASCHKCHGLKTPGNYTAKEWDKVLPSMKRAKLSQEQNEQVHSYVLAFCKKESTVN